MKSTTDSATSVPTPERDGQHDRQQAEGVAQDAEQPGPAAEGEGAADDEQDRRAGDEGQQDRGEPEGRGLLEAQHASEACQTWRADRATRLRTSPPSR